MVLCGSAVLRSLDVTADLLAEHPRARLVVTGGRGHSTPALFAAVRPWAIADDGSSEAAVLAALLVSRHGVDAEQVILEEASTHCGENASLTAPLLPDGRVVVVQDPTMQRRTHESFRRALAGRDVTISSRAPFVPVVRRDGGYDDVGDRAWDLDRFVDLVLGELRRLRDDERGYGPRGTGFIGHVDLPPEVEASARVLGEAFPGAARG
ncbi:YdcF family protein [Nocardioides terrigena]|uniref:YdcF family protein n=1 Tax=Nocardioides terrigena TaxID=424797 RepID=UPI002D7A2D23|nr:YdcF family protein [Nocardioides terrigena]